MNSNLDTTIQQAHIEFRARRDAFATKLQAALQSTGWTVASVMPTADWMTGQLTVTKPEVHANFKMYYQFEIKGSSWHRGTPSKLTLKVGQEMGYRSRAARYTKLDDALILRLVADIDTTLAGVMEYEKRQAEANDEKARFEHRRVMELAGYLNPPGTEISIITGNGPDAGSYSVRFHQGSITSAKLTRNQVIKLMDVLNEIQGTKDALIIVSKHALDGSELVWGGHGWWAAQQPNLYASEAEAQYDIARAKAQTKLPETVQIVRYDSRFTIKPGNPVNRRLY